jgi:hypothetical protein
VAKVANPTEDPAFQRCQDYAELLARLQAAGIEAPRWLRAGLFRQVAAAAGIEPPKARPRLRQIAGDAPC